MLYILIDPYLKTKVLLICIKIRNMREMILNDPPFDYFNPKSKDPRFSRSGKSINPIQVIVCILAPHKYKVTLFALGCAGFA